MNSDVIKSHMSALETWADHWERDTREGSLSIANALRRAAKMMSGDQRIETLPEPSTVSEVQAD